MSARAWVNVALLVVVIGLAMIAVWAPGQRAPDPASALLALSSDQVEHIAITAGEGEDIRLQRLAEGWQLVAPFQAPASASRVEALLRLGAAKSKARFRAEEQELANFGLAPPKVRLQLDDVSLAFGDTDPINDQRYVLVGNEVHLIDDTGFRYLTADPTGLVSRKLVPAGAELEAVTLPDMEIRRQGRGEWVVSGDGSPGAARALARAWQQARAQQVSRRTSGDGEPVLLYLAGGVTVRYQILRRSPHLVLYRSDLGLSYQLRQAQVDSLLKLAADDASSDQGPAAEGEAG